MGGRADVRPPAGAERRRPEVLVRRRADDREQRDGDPPRVGPDAEGRVPALPGAARQGPALPERLRLPGPLGRGRGREVARPELQARDRGVRARRVQRPLRRARRRVRRGDHRAVEAPRHVDGLGQRLLHVLRHEHRVHLALPQGGARPGLALPGPPLDPVVPALRDVALPARAGRRGELRGARPPVALRPLPAEGTRGRVADRLDDDAVDAARKRRRRGQARRRVRAAGRRLAARRERRRVRPRRPRRGARRARVLGAVRRLPGAGGGRPPRDPVGRGRARRGHRDRPHRPGRRHRGLRALEGPRPAGARADRRERPHLPGLRLPRGDDDRRGRGAGDRRAARARPPGRGRADHPPLPDLLALPHAARLPRRRRLVHRRRRGARAAPRREPDGRVDAAAVREADGRLAPQHGRLEHLAEALLRPAAALLPVPVRAPERGRLARGARGARDRRARAAAGAPPPVDRRGQDPLRVVRSRGRAHPRGRRRLARRGDRAALDARLGDRRSTCPAATRPARPRG